jgi:hypothetical protein
MSINHFFNKIKRSFGFETKTIVFIFVVIGVGISAFGLGELSARQRLGLMAKSDNSFISKNDNSNLKSEIKIINLENDKNNNSVLEEKVYVASKNGKLYYRIGCSGAGRIKEENKIYFKTKEDAEKFGYTLSSSCK